LGSLSEEALEAFSQFHHGVVILRGGVNRGPVLLVSKLGKQVAVSVKALVVKVGVGSRLHHDSAFWDVWRERVERKKKKEKTLLRWPGNFSKKRERNQLLRGRLSIF